MNDDPETGVVVRYHADTKELHVLVDRTLCGVPNYPAVRVEWDSNGLRIILPGIGKEAVEGTVMSREEISTAIIRDNLMGPGGFWHDG